MVVRITPADVGERVTVRATDPEGGFVDALGHLLAWEGGWLRIERRDGTLTEVPEERLVAGRTLGPPPQRRRGTQRDRPPDGR